MTIVMSITPPLMRNTKPIHTLKRIAWYWQSTTNLFIRMIQTIIVFIADIFLWNALFVEALPFVFSTIYRINYLFFLKKLKKKKQKSCFDFVCAIAKILPWMNYNWFHPKNPNNHFHHRNAASFLYSDCSCKENTMAVCKGTNLQIKNAIKNFHQFFLLFTYGSLFHLSYLYSLHYHRIFLPLECIRHWRIQNNSCRSQRCVWLDKIWRNP